MNRTTYMQNQNVQSLFKEKSKIKNILFCTSFIFLAAFLLWFRPISAKHSSGRIMPIKQQTAPLQKNMRTDDKWYLLLVNPWNPIPQNFTIELKQLKNGQSVDKRIYPYLQSMMNDARAAGLSPLICSSFRTAAKQARLFNNLVCSYRADGYSEAQAKVLAEKHIAVPGTSEHQIGLAVDIVAESNQMLNKSQENTPEQQWLIKNCYKYGFILRYPSNKKAITGISYEPWHYRYVGKKAAEEIMKKGICFEEYIKNNDQGDIRLCKSK